MQTQEPVRGDVITPEMRKRVDISEGDRGGFAFLVKMPKTIIDDLLKYGYLEGYHRHYAIGFMELRHANKMKSSYQPNGIYREVMNFLSLALSASETFDLIRHEMGVPQCESTIRIICDAMDSPSEGVELMARVGEIYRQEFDKLISAMDKVKEKHLATGKELA